LGIFNALIYITYALGIGWGFYLGYQYYQNHNKAMVVLFGGGSYLILVAIMRFILSQIVKSSDKS